jgi:DNA processing protein
VGDRAKLEHLNRSVSVVGSRGATGYGEWATTDIVADLVARGFSIVSGGAYGIDGIAHRAALMAKGVTFAVMAGGVNRFYPSGHEELLTQVRGSGAVLAELPPGAAPTKWRFLQRNRLVAALGLVTLVVEAGKRSGSISTANHAMALERPVAAVPGPISSSASVGTNRLISQSHAELVVSGQDVAYLAGDQDQLNLFGGQQDLGSLETRALDALSSRQKTQQQVASEAGLDQIEVAIALSNLLLLGLVVQRDGMWLRASPN